MTPQEQIAYLRDAATADSYLPRQIRGHLVAVCDLAERALVLEAAVRAYIQSIDDPNDGDRDDVNEAVLRRLLGDTP